MNVLFDLDGTLTDSRAGIIACIRHALAELGVEASDESNLERFIGSSLRDVFRELVGDHPARINAAIAAYRGRFGTVGMFENSVYPGIPEALTALTSRGARLFLATAKPRFYAVQIIEYFGLAGHFERLYGSELDGTRTDKTDLIAHILHDADLDRTRTIMVGDRHHDMRGAANNVVHSAGALWGYGSREELHSAGAGMLCERPADLKNLLVR